MIVGILLAAAALLAFANGANDNFKGVATLFGSGTTSYRRALVWATLTTLLGSLLAVVLAGSLLKNFSGKGLVDDSLVTQADYAAAVALGAGLAVLVATRLGLPVSTTHALVGALVGSGMAAGSNIDLMKLGGSFFLPLLLSPLLAMTVTAVVYPVLRFTRRRLGIAAETCLCVGTNVVEVVPAGDHLLALQRAEQLGVHLGDAVTCRSRYTGSVLGIEAAAAVDQLHIVSAGMVSFARGLNDTPKIAALMLLTPQLGGVAGTAVIGAVIAVGGVAGARRVAETMSRRITTMNHGQGFTSNLMTSLIVISATRLGMPVSTTHVSCGSLFGMGAVTGQADGRVVLRILAAWLTTLPLGGVLGAASLLCLRSL